MKSKGISNGNFAKLLGVGFLSFIVTFADDIIVFLPLFSSKKLILPLIILGIIIATILEIIVIIYFSKKVQKLKFTKHGRINYGIWWAQ